MSNITRALSQLFFFVVMSITLGCCVAAGTKSIALGYAAGMALLSINMTLMLVAETVSNAIKEKK